MTRGGSTRRWRDIRATVLLRDGHQCRLRRPAVCVGVATHVHHLHGKTGACAWCDADASDHLVAACAPCNLAIGDPSRHDPPPQRTTNWRSR